MADTGSGQDPRGSGGFTVHIADELEVYFNEVAHGRPVGFVGSLKWKPPTDVYETEDAVVVHMDIAGMRAGDFHVECLTGSGRDTRCEGRCRDFKSGNQTRRHVYQTPVPAHLFTTRSVVTVNFVTVKHIRSRPSGQRKNPKEFDIYHAKVDRYNGVFVKDQKHASSA